MGLSSGGKTLVNMIDMRAETKRIFNIKSWKHEMNIWHHDSLGGSGRTFTPHFCLLSSKLLSFSICERPVSTSVSNACTYGSSPPPCSKSLPAFSEPHRSNTSRIDSLVILEVIISSYILRLKK